MMPWPVDFFCFWLFRRWLRQRIGSFVPTYNVWFNAGVVMLPTLCETILLGALMFKPHELETYIAFVVAVTGFNSVMGSLIED
jgi:hypothetical protein